MKKAPCLAQCARQRDGECGAVSLTRVELDELSDLAAVQVDADRVVDLDEGVRVADGPGVVRHQVGHPPRAHHELPHLAELVLRAGRVEMRHLAQTLHSARLLGASSNALTGK